MAVVNSDDAAGAGVVVTVVAGVVVMGRAMVFAVGGFVVPSVAGGAVALGAFVEERDGDFFVPCWLIFGVDWLGRNDDRASRGRAVRVAAAHL